MALIPTITYVNYLPSETQSLKDAETYYTKHCPLCGCATVHVSEDISKYYCHTCKAKWRITSE